MLRLISQFDFVAFRQAITRGLPPWLLEPLGAVAREMLQSFDRAKAGRRRGSRRQRSAPGEPPARQSGRLAASITQPAMVSDLAAELRVTAPYAEFLEHGTARMAARPFARVAVDTVQQSFEAGRVGLM